MKIFALYTLARLVLFAVAYGLIWLIVGHWMPWDSVSALSTALVAMVISSIVALIWLRGLRHDFAVRVGERAERAMAAFQARKAAEDDDDPPTDP